MSNGIIIQVTIPEFKLMISEIFQSELQKSKPSVEKRPEQSLLTRKEGANYLKVSLPTFDSLTKQGEIQAHIVGKLIRFKKEEIEAAFSKRGNLKNVKGGSHGK